VLIRGFSSLITNLTLSQEKTPAARSFSRYVTPTEADDFSTSEEEDIEHDGINPGLEPAVASMTAPFTFTTGTISTPARLSIFDLSLPLSQHILSHVFADCVEKYDKPDWYDKAKTILRLTPQEEDWLVDKYLVSAAKPTLQETWGEDEDPWHFDAAKNQRAELKHKFRYDPGTTLKWLEDSTRGYIGQEDVGEATRYLRERGFGVQIIERMELAQFLDDVAEDGEESTVEDVDAEMTEIAHSIETD
jgi:hypothetical protein